MSAKRVGLCLALPLLLAIVTTGFVVNTQFDRLSKEFSAEVEHALKVIPEVRIELSEDRQAQRRAKLQAQIQRALDAIEPLRRLPDTEWAQKVAKEILGKLQFDDGHGYFYVYTFDGICLVHPAKPSFVGQHLITLHDSNGTPVIANLRDIAITNMRGGKNNRSGFTEYLWKNPEDNQVSRKLALVTAIPEWGWMVGTGVYFYEVQSALLRMQVSLKKVGDDRSATIMMAVAPFLLLIAAGGYVLSRAEKWEETHSNAKRLADQSEALARFVHGDVISKFSRAHEVLEDLLQRMPPFGNRADECKVSETAVPPVALKSYVSDAVAYLDEARALLRSSANEAIPLIKHPPLLDRGDPDLLVGKIESVCQRFSQRWANRGRCLQATVSEKDLMSGLSEERVTRILQFLEEALLNCEKHAQNASRVEVIIAQKSRHLALVIRDNGNGFNLEEAAYGLCNGRGLRDLQAHAAWLGGCMLLKPVAGQNEIVLTVPLV